MRVHALPADYGDCLWIEYGPDPDHPKRILIDGGTDKAFPALRARIEDLDEDDRHFELLVITHIDTDHIDGVLELLRHRVELNVSFGEVWFNGWVHLLPENAATLGPVQGEELTELLADPTQFRWNSRMHQLGTPNGGAVVTHADGTPLQVDFDDDMTITILSPTVDRLAKLNKTWETVVKAAGLVPGFASKKAAAAADDALLGDESIDELAAMKGSSDSSKANGSSIALLLEADGQRALLTGDAFKGVLTKAMKTLAKPDKRLKVDLFKLSHHGSKNNTSTRLLQALDCQHYLVCTNGAVHDHPDDRTIAWVIREGRPSTGDDVVLLFNYLSDRTRRWGDDPGAQAAEGFAATYPAAADQGVSWPPDDDGGDGP